MSFWLHDTIGISIGIMLIVLSVALLHYLGQDSKNMV